MLVLINKKKIFHRININKSLQLLASVSWMVSVLIYGLNSSADYFQLIASCAWTVSNLTKN